jgi:hypothetical protein
VLFVLWTWHPRCIQVLTGDVLAKSKMRIGDNGAVVVVKCTGIDVLGGYARQGIDELMVYDSILC